MGVARRIGLIGVQSNQYPRALDIARPFRKAGIPVAMGGFHVSGCLSMLKTQGQSVLVIDKNVGNLAKIADRHYMIERGRTVWSGTSEQLLAEPDLQHRYLGI